MPLLVPGYKFIKLSFMSMAKKAGPFVLCEPLQPNTMFVSKAGAYPSGTSFWRLN
jgi:hypothetical protein